MVYGINDNMSQAMFMAKMNHRASIAHRGCCNRPPRRDWVRIETSKGDRMMIDPNKYGQWPLQGIINKARAHKMTNNTINAVAHRMYG